MVAQVPLPFHLDPEQSFAAYVAGSNSTVLAALQATATGSGDALVYLWGESGLGKSHLLNACCQAAQAAGRRSACLPLRELCAHGPALLDGMESMDLLCLDDVQAIAGNRDWELALFHLYNRLRDNGKYLIVTADTVPPSLRIELADLRSRLAWGLTLRLHPLTDEDKLAALTQRARQLGMRISPKVGNYLLAHCQRDWPSLCRLLAGLDQATLAAQRRLTVPFLKQYLQDHP
ncbi:MAG: DnaA regulatory inactivator Hda [Methylococcaceae bacterium]|nr:MAG: DnaA regulatory inactivator Hda [Methylococcaceae bacterium]